MPPQDAIDAIQEYIALSDVVLVQQARDGKQNAFEMLVQRYSTILLNFSLFYVKEHTQACDILQQVWLRLFLALPTLHTERSLKSWLLQVTHNCCIDELRHRRALHFSELEANREQQEVPEHFTLLDSTPSPEEIAELHELRQRLQQAIHALPPKYQAIVTLRYTAQLRFSEIAQMLRIPEASAKTSMQRAKKMLRSSLREWVESPSH
jgi:RNA polymerase sigma factor (sigma-70 family)